MGFLGGLANAIGVAVFSQFLLAALAMTTAAATLAGIVLGLAIDPSFIRIPYTTGPIIDTGWVVVRDFANMLIVFFLIIIGLGTALRLGQYAAKKTLPKLIGVALLINFTPVITGFIVDVSNIFMNFFLGGLAGVGLVTSLFTNLTSTVGDNLLSFSLIPKVLALMIFQVAAAVIFMLFAALFIMRHIAIWILVILSPIAFVASILPRTSGLFKMWWNQFFQWSIIGVFAAFFLWLGDHIISIAAQGKLVAPAPPGGVVSGVFTNIINDLMPFGIALAMLFVGFFVALQSSAMGAGATQAFTTKGLKWGGASAGTAAWRRFGGAVTAPGAKLAGVGSSWQQWGAGKQGVGGRPIGALVSAAGWGVRMAGEVSRAGAMEMTKQVHLRDYDAFNKGVAETAPGKMGDSKDVFAAINAELLKPVPNKNRILGLLAGVRNRGDADDIQNAFDPEKNGALVGKETKIGELIKLGRNRIGPNGERPLFKAFYGQIMADPNKWGFNIDDKELQRDDQGNAVKDAAGRPMFTQEAIAKKGSDAEYLTRMKSKIMARMVPADFATDENSPGEMDPTTPGGEIFHRSLAIERGSEFVGQIFKKRDRELREKINKFYGEIPDEWLVENGADDILKWFTSNGARNIGLTRSIKDPKTGLSRQITIQDVERMKEAFRPTIESITNLEQNIAKMRAELAKSAQVISGGGLSPDRAKANQELREDITRQEQALNLARARLQNQPPAAGIAPSSSSAPSREGYTGGTGPTREPRPGRPT